MADSSRRAVASVAVAFVLSTPLGCARSPGAAATSVRLTAISVTADTGIDAARLVDRDTTAALAIDRPTRIVLGFRHAVRLDRLKVHGATNLDVASPRLGSLSPDGDGGWSSASFGSALPTMSVEVLLTPTAPGASLTELELWGPAFARAPRDLESLAEATRPAATRPGGALGAVPAGSGPLVGHATDVPAVPPEDLLAVVAEPAAGTLKVDPVDPADRCLRARLSGGIAVRSARRAYLVYEANVQRSIVLSTSLDGGAPSGGLWLAATDRRATLVSEVDPEQLSGSDDVALCLPSEATADVSVDGLRLVLLLDSGRDGFDRDAERVLGAAADGDAKTSAGLAGTRLELGLDRATSMEEASIWLSSPSARLYSVGSFDGMGWTEQGNVSLVNGANAIAVGGRRASALEVTFEGARPDMPAAIVSEISLEGSGVGPRVPPGKLVIAYPRLALRDGALTGERFGDRAYLAGWAGSPAAGATVEVDGAAVSVGGAFAVPLLRPVGSTGSWAVTVRARFADGTEAVKVVHLDDDRAAEIASGASGVAVSEDARFGAEDATSWGVLGSKGGRVALGTDVVLEAPEGAVSADTRIGISRKGYEVVPKLDAGMINVSAPAQFAYRFLPTGQKFAKPVRITLPYDPDLLPEGMLPEEIQTYYYDDGEKRWMTLTRAEVRRASRQIVSETTHFTFMINAVLVLPDHPGPVSFNPNSIKDLKAADPSSGIDLVEAPGGNSQGSAKLSFPIRLPKGRGAHQPSLGLVYDSSGADGWVGVGWDLPVSSVSIDTRYGVPLYDGEERYLLDGEALVPVAAVATCAGGQAGRPYQARVERDFKRVVRCGPDTTGYWFEVTDKGGTLYVYGQGENARLRSYVPHLSAIPRYPPAYDIGQWFLERVVDASGNGTQYLYQQDNRGPEDATDGRLAEDFRQVYLSDIWYTSRGDRRGGTVGSQAPYHVRLDHVRPDQTSEYRRDWVTSGRLGFKTVTRKLLGTIAVTLGSTPIREYRLAYEPGDFQKSRLKSIEVHGADASVFYTHRFEYTGKVAEAMQASGRVSAFAGPYAWNEPQGLGGSDGAAMTASLDTGAGGQFFVGIGTSMKKEDGTVGAAVGYNYRESKTQATFLDVNGDRLPDRMWRQGGAWLDTPLAPGPSGTLAGAISPAPPPGDPYSPSGAVFTIPPEAGLGKETSHVVNSSVQVIGYGATANFGGSYSITESKELVIDANGDGLPDLLEDGRVFFNHPRCTTAGACFAPDLPSAAYQPPEYPFPQIATDPTIAAAASAASDATSPEDLVLEWNAPFDGLVDLSGVLSFNRQPLLGGRHDGVRLRIYSWHPPPPPLDFETTAPTLVDEYYQFPDATTPTAVADQVTVYRGDTLYFVLSTLQDFPLVQPPGDPPPRPYSAEEVGFAPVVAYVSAEAPALLPGPSRDPFIGYPFAQDKFRDQVDPTGAPVYRYDSRADLRLAGDPRVAVSVPATGTLVLTSHLTKQASADDVQLCVEVFDAGTYPGGKPYEPATWTCQDGRTRWRSERYASETTVDRDLAPLRLDVKAGSMVLFRVETRLSIDPATVSWTIHGRMECVAGQDGTCRAPATKDLEDALSFDALPYLHVHAPVTPRDHPWSLDRWLAADPRPFKPFVAPVSGRVRVRFSGKTNLLPPLQAAYPITFAVRTPRRLIASNVNAIQYDAEVDVAADEPVFLEAHAESDLQVAPAPWINPYPGASAPYSMVGSVTFRPDGDDRWYPTDATPTFTTCRRGDVYEYGNAPLLSGGYHGWRHGVWQGKVGEDFQPWVYRSLTRAKADDWKDLGAADQKSQMKDPNDPMRKRARLMALLVPRPAATQERLAGLAPAGVNAWASTDGNAYLYAGGMSAARRGGTHNQPQSAGAPPPTATFGLGNVGRLTVGQNHMAGLSVGPASMQIGTGISQQKEDLIDLNGDGIPDVVLSGGLPDVSTLTGDGLGTFLGAGATSEARITNPADFSYRESVAIPIYPRLNLDASGQVGMGVSEAVKLLLSKLKVAAVVARWPDMSIGGGVGVNQATTVEDLVDVNGDGLPDAVRKSDACGGFAVRLNLGTSFARGEDCLATGAWGTNGLTGVAGALDPGGTPNPDEDPDVTRGLGLAGGIAARGRDPTAIRQVSTLTVQGSLDGATAIDKGEQLGASISSESSLSATNVALIDVTGDGLPDLVARKNDGSDFLVMVNLGYGFAPPQRWSAPAWPAGVKKPRFHVSAAGALTGAGAVAEAFLAGASDGIDPVEASGTHGDLPTVGFMFTISIPLGPETPWLHLSFGTNAHYGRTTGFELGLQDIDGDGFADHVLKTSDNGLVMARVNRLGGGNLLKRVIRPLGGSFDLDYLRVGNTVDMPEGRYVLSKVTVHDGVAAGTGHDIATRYEYLGGYHDRNEREFLGFATVARTNADESKLVQTFLNGDFRHKGLLRSETVLDPKGRKFVETVNDYWDPPLVGTAVDTECVRRTPASLVYPDAGYCAPSFVPLRSAEKRFYEGQEVAGLVSRQAFKYDGFGNVSTFDDLGDVADPSDDVHAEVTYGPPQAAEIYCVGAPTEIVATDRTGNVLRHRQAVYDEHCRLKELRSLIDGTQWATAKLDWWDDGNLKTVTSPPNHRGESYSVDYDYDGVAAAYVTYIKDVHGYQSFADYDFRFGENTYTKDVNGQETRRSFDAFGRLKAVAAPGFTLSAPTIDITYAHEAAVPYALTRNALPQGGTLDTVIAMDGLGRVIQTKKTAEVRTTGESTAVGWAVTGQQLFDAMGRVAEQGQTFFESGATPDFHPGTPKNPTRLFYDVLGRTLQTVEPNGAITRVDFGIGVPMGTGFKRLQATATDALGKVRVVYKDPADRTVVVEEHVDGRTPTTTYDYDPVGELVTVTDAAGNKTVVGYDLLGRRTSLQNPDAGLVEFHYDLAGNLTDKIDANLRSQTSKISYVYDYERLKEIHYPNAARNVTYEYGLPGAAENAAARITRVVDEVGEETRGYDVLGNLARTTRTINPLRPGDRIRTFVTTFQFDVFGRMLSMVYPDGETLKYGYDRGGLLKSARGERPATKHDPAQYEAYLEKLLYDEFGQRVHMRVGNGAVTEYGYEPLTRRLSTLHAQKPGERLLQNLSYGYDLVGNVLGVKNGLGEAQPSHAGDVTFTYAYDDLHRLTYAHGEAKSRPSTLDTFTSHFTYSDIHNMMTNVQEHHVLHGATGGGEYPPHTNHAFEYQYAGTGPHQATRIGDTWLTYDGNGNTLRECRDPADSTCTQRPSHLRRFLWTEENRLDAVIDAGGRHVTKFLYDASGERIAKLGRGGESITIGQFWALKGRRAATKHVFAGTTRLASKVLPPPGWDDVPRGPPPGGTTTTSTTTGTLVNDNGCNPSNYQPQKCTILPGGDPVLNDYYADALVRPETYYYHPDHLGSTSWVTDQNARVHDHLEYFPYGEVWRDPRSDVGASPVQGQRFLFTGKELDEETGLYYFGARYYDARKARWTSPDPLGLEIARKRTSGLALFSYASLSPVRRVDPDGREDWDPCNDPGIAAISNSQASATKTGFATAQPYVEEGLQATPQGGAFVLFSGKRLTNTEDATLFERIGGGLALVGGVLSKAGARAISGTANWLGRSRLARLLRLSRAAEEAATASRAARIVTVAGREMVELENGLRFTPYYMDKLWSTGRKAPGLIAQEVIEGHMNVPISVAVGSRPGEQFLYYRAMSGRANQGWEVVFNPVTREVYHLEPIPDVTAPIQTVWR